MKNFIELLRDYPEVSVTVKVKDLLEVVNYCVDKTRAEMELRTADDAAETYITVAKTAEMLNVDKSSLWRWSKKNYLVPITVGGKRLYRSSDIHKILEGGK